MFVIEDLKNQTIDRHVEKQLAKDCIIDSDNSTSYTNLSNLVAKYCPKVIEKEMVGKMLPWVHIAISNAKRILLNTFHDIKSEYLQNYLNKFCYKFNRRYFGEAMFDRLMLASVATKNKFRYNIR